MKVFKTLKFKLTLVYSIILIIFSASFVFTFNLAMKRVIVPKAPPTNMLMQRFYQFSDRDYEILKLSREHDLEKIREVSLYSLIPLTMFSFVAGFVISGAMLKPIEDLSEEIKSKTTGNLGEQIEYEDNGDEISILIKSFNVMSSNLATSFDKQKEFVQNASHEIKTPLAIVSANLDIALDDPNIGKKELKEILNDSKSSIIFMNKLTEDLLLLSFVDSQINFEKLKLNSIIKEAVEISKSLIINNKLTISISETEDIEILGNRVLLIRAFQNIIENAIKYSQGSEVVIKLEKNDSSVITYIRDNGIGIDFKERNKIFERFYRLDKSRSRSTGGTGLGLAISKEIFQKHNGEIILIKSRKGTAFKITMQIV